MAEDPHADEPLLEIPHGKAAYCGGCAYDVRGLTLDRCPECGERLRRVGVLGERPKPGSALVRAVLFLLVFIPSALILRLVCLSPLPNLYTEHVEGVLVRQLDSQTALAASFASSGTALIWPLGGDNTIERKWDLAVGTVSLSQDSPWGRRVDDAQVRNATMASTPIRIDSTRGQASGELVESLEQHGVPDAHADEWASELSTILPLLMDQGDRYDRGRMKSWLPGGWGRSASGGAQVEPAADRWQGAIYGQSLAISKHPLAEASVTLFFVLLGLAGLGLVVANIDPRPHWLGGPSRSDN